MLLKLSEIKTSTKPEQWAIFERQKLIHQHISENGMINPIVVNSDYELQFGGCRLQYAHLNGWDNIEVIICNEINEVRKLQDEHSLFEHSFLDEQYIERQI